MEVLFLLMMLAVAGLMLGRAFRGQRASLPSARADTSEAPDIWRPSPEPARVTDLVDDHGFFEIGRHYFVNTARSPDGRYLVGASDGDIDAQGRRRKGACALKDLRTGEVCFKVAITRANNPHVSNHGCVLVEDWKDQSLSGALVALSRTGERLWTNHYKANIFASGLSADGARAFVSTCNSDYEPHSGKTFLLDAATGKVVWDRDGWGDVRFDGDVLVAEVTDESGPSGCFPFDDGGDLPAAYDQALAQVRAHRERGMYWAVLPKVQAALKGPTPDIASAKELLAELDGKEADIPKPRRAQLLRFRGEIAAAEGDTAAALAHWQQALALIQEWASSAATKRCGQSQ